MLDAERQGERAELVTVGGNWVRFVEPAARLVVWRRGVRGADVSDEAALFLNVPQHIPAGLEGWITFLRGGNYGVFAKPKQGDSDIDEEMVVQWPGCAVRPACQSSDV